MSTFASSVPDAAVLGVDTAVSAKRKVAWPLWVAAGLLWGILSRHLGLEWSVNEQYSYGWFVPFLALYLFWMRWPERPARVAGVEHRLSWSVCAGMVVALVLMLPIRAMEVANPDWRPMSWLHALIAVGLSLVAIWKMGGWPWVRYFAFPIGFFLVAVPWVTPIEAPIIQGLQRFVASLDTGMMNLLGIPAELEGSVIRLRTGVVGVNEACSGVRSLQTSLMAGLLFGELNRLTVGRRVFLALSVVGLALGANVFRGAFLVWTAAARGVGAVEGVHDLAGNMVLGIVVLGSFGIAALLKQPMRPGNALAEGGVASARDFGHPLSVRWIAAVVCWLIVVEIGVEGWYRAHEIGLIPTARWSARWPVHETGFRPGKIDERTKLLLRYDEGGSGTWQAPAEEGNRAKTPWTMYFFRWNSGKSSSLRARAHRPDICFPATGWKQTADRGVEFYRVGNGLSLPFRHFQFEHPTGGGTKTFADAFFCLQEDKIRKEEATSGNVSPAISGDSGKWAMQDRLQTVVQGRRDFGQQVMEIVITTPQKVPVEAIQHRFAEQLSQIVVQKSPL